MDPGKRAVLLVQLAPGHARDDARLAYFLRLVPDWMRIAVAFRRRSWHSEETSRCSTRLAPLTA